MKTPLSGIKCRSTKQEKELKISGKTVVGTNTPISFTIRNCAEGRLIMNKQPSRKVGVNAKVENKHYMFNAPGEAQLINRKDAASPKFQQTSRYFGKLISRWYENEESREEVERLEALGKVVKAIRKAKNVSLEVVAEKCNRTSIFILHLESGMVDLEEAKDVLASLSESLGVAEVFLLQKISPSQPEEQRS